MQQRRGRRAAPRARAGARLALWLLLAAGCAATARAALSAAQGDQWASYVKELSSAEVGTKSLSTSLSKVLSHTYSTPLPAVLSSNSYTGANARLRRIVADLMAGRAVTVAAVGGLATNGTDASEPGRSDYLARFVTYLERAFPTANITAVRSSAGVAPSAVVAACGDQFLPQNADIVLLELTANDAATMDSSIVNPMQPKAYELLLRRALKAPRQPAVVLTQTMGPGMGNATKPFFMTPESPHYAAVAGYYNVPTVSMRNALWASGERTQDGKMATLAVARDGATPTDDGHAAIADALVFLIQATAADLQLLPYGDWDGRSQDGDVPQKTMYGGLDAPKKVLTAATCSWVRNATVSPSGGCPTEVNDMCKLNYTSYDAARQSYKALGLSEAATADEDGNLVPRRKAPLAAIIGGVVGAFLGLGFFVGVIASVVIKRRRHMADVEAAWEQKRAAAAPAAAAGRGAGVASPTGGFASPAGTFTGGGRRYGGAEDDSDDL
ncbi:hypothetical protein Rsub_04337 [Raphidocelis subcapitata]|uniref:SGNH hydrolase-type esterase domain-containing protein n=1 Tax=Raphidocelis subcapitata TaxID=307507 RepID=A0A2V0P315_9CHLO|nr:hypothetical protein Rsub_04337 [Raphidocelis subcapitata]|eukprot:GBF91597.1 hypothetical protein Rsub_04337 [Raphidocelis subcapitata]